MTKDENALILREGEAQLKAQTQELRSLEQEVQELEPSMTKLNDILDKTKQTTQDPAWADSFNRVFQLLVMTLDNVMPTPELYALFYLGLYLGKNYESQEVADFLDSLPDKDLFASIMEKMLIRSKIMGG